MSLTTREGGSGTGEASRRRRSSTIRASLDLEIFKCSGCKRTATSPTMVCGHAQKPHIFCGFCTTRMGLREEGALCQECNTLLSPSVIVDLVLQSKVPCPNRSEGCQKTLKTGQIMAHNQVCDFRHVRCYVLKERKCGGELYTRSSYFDHLFFEHKMKIVEWFDVIRLSHREVHNSGPFDYEVEYFHHRNMLYFMHRRREFKIMYFWVSSFSNDEKAENIRLKMLFNGIGEKALTIVYYMNPVPLHSTLDDVKKTGKLASLDVCSLNSFSQVNDDGIREYIMNREISITDERTERNSGGVLPIIIELEDSESENVGGEEIVAADAIGEELSQPPNVIDPEVAS